MLERLRASGLVGRVSEEQFGDGPLAKRRDVEAWRLRSACVPHACSPRTRNWYLARTRDRGVRVRARVTCRFDDRAATGPLNGGRARWSSRAWMQGPFSVRSRNARPGDRVRRLHCLSLGRHAVPVVALLGARRVAAADLFWKSPKQNKSKRRVIAAGPGAVIWPRACARCRLMCWRRETREHPSGEEANICSCHVPPHAGLDHSPVLGASSPMSGTSTTSNPRRRFRPARSSASTANRRSSSWSIARASEVDAPRSASIASGVASAQGRSRYCFGPGDLTRTPSSWSRWSRRFTVAWLESAMSLTSSSSTIAPLAARWKTSAAPGWDIASSICSVRPSMHYSYLHSAWKSRLSRQDIVSISTAKEQDDAGRKPDG